MKELFVQALVAVSLLTTLTVEGLKKLFDEFKVSYKPNILAVIVSVVLSIVSVILYMVYFGIALNGQIIVLTICLVFLSFLCATVGYDKVIQTIKQIIGG